MLSIFLNLKESKYSVFIFVASNSIYFYVSYRQTMHLPKRALFYIFDCHLNEMQTFYVAINVVTMI